MDGHSHALSFIGSVFGTKAIGLGVDEFGQSGTQIELYDYYGISTRAIVQAFTQALEDPKHLWKTRLNCFDLSCGHESERVGGR